MSERELSDLKRNLALIETWHQLLKNDPVFKQKFEIFIQESILDGLKNDSAYREEIKNIIRKIIKENSILFKLIKWININRFKIDN